MAQIDLRHAIIRIKDGYAGPSQAGGLVNNMAGYMAGVSTITVDGFVGTVAVGDTFTVATDSTNTVYTVTSQTATLGNTTSIVFTPVLGDAITDDAAITILPHSIEINIGDGNLTYDEKRNMKYIRNRNVLDTVRLDQDEPMEVKLDALWEFIRADSGEPPTIEDALKQRGQASTWVTSAEDTCEPYAVDVEIEYDPPCSDQKREIVLLTDFRYESFSHDLKMGVFAVTGKCNVTEATVSRID